MSYKLRLKELREAKGMSQRAIADAVGVTPGAVARWELGENQPTTANLVAMTAVLGCTLDELVDIQTTAQAPA